MNVSRWCRTVGMALIIMAALWIGSLSGSGQAFAADPINYLGENGDIDQITEYSVVGNGDRYLRNGWNVVQGEVKTGLLYASKDTKLILTDDSTLTVMSLSVTKDQSLEVYAQSKDEHKGRLIAEPDHIVGGAWAGIGGRQVHTGSGDAGKITINGGYVKSSGQSGAGIGGAEALGGGEVIINGGEIHAEGDSGSAAIGGGPEGSAGAVTINGGKVHAAGEMTGAAIGGGNEGKAGTVTINGGEIRAGGLVGIGAGSRCGAVTVTINDGKVFAEAQGFEDTADGCTAIGAGDGARALVAINGGEISARSQGLLAVGIGGHTLPEGEENAKISISGGKVSTYISPQGNMSRGCIGTRSGQDQNRYDITLSWSSPDDEYLAAEWRGNVTFSSGKRFLYKANPGYEEVSAPIDPGTIIPRAYTVTYDPGNGSGQMPEHGANPNQAITLPKCAFQPPAEGPDAGSSFKAWAIDGEMYHPGERVTILGDAKVTALWGAIPVTVSGIKAKDKVYDGMLDAEMDCGEAVLTGVIEGDEVGVKATGRFTSVSAEDQKTVRITAMELTGKDAGGYVLAAEGQQKNATASITPRPVTVYGIMARDKIYDGNSRAQLDDSFAVLGNVVGNDMKSMKVRVTGEGTFKDPDDPDREDANVGGNKPVSLPAQELVSAGSELSPVLNNYTLTEEGMQKTAKASIVPRRVTITADDQSGPYGVPPEPTCTVGDGWCEQHQPAVAFAATDDEGKDVTSAFNSGRAPVGEYTITPCWASGSDPIKGNYIATFVPGIFNVTEGELQVNASGYDDVYDGQPHGITVEVQGEDAGNAVVYYLGVNDEGEETSSAEAPTRTDVGTTSVRYVVDCPNYETFEGTEEIVIRPRPVTVTAKAQTVKPGGSISTDLEQVILSGQAAGHSLSDALLTATDTQTITDNGVIYVSNAKITDGTNDVTANYDITYEEGRLTVSDEPDPGPTPTPGPTPGPTPNSNPTPSSGPDHKATPAPTPGLASVKTVSGTPLMKMTSKGKTGLVLRWNKIGGADGYDIFLAECNHKGKRNSFRNVRTIKGNSTFTWTKRGLKKRTNYKAYVKAYVLQKDSRSGRLEKTYMATTPVMHACTSGGTKKYTNAKSVKVKRTKVKLKKGEIFRIKASVKKLKKNKKLLSGKHAPKLRYMTSNGKVATVSKSGRITAKGKGTCSIYVFAHNGVSKRVTVVVR